MQQRDRRGVEAMSDGEAWKPHWGDGDVARLLRLVRESIAWALDGRVAPFDFGDCFARPALCVPAATFVTLHDARGGLRGCVGGLHATDALARSVHRNALRAAFEDRRFPPVRTAERDALRVEISVLSPPRRIDSPAAFVPGRHGVVLRAGERSAVYLPQVATEQGWSREQTLDALSRKAGLPADAWREPGVELDVFEGEVLQEVSRDEA
jgi:AmmeMemoRadiSam system protein A